MNRLAIISSMALASLATTNSRGQEPAEPSKATFLITGLHCPPCTRTVEGSLQRTKGVKSVSVDWRTKNAKVVFDEAELPAALLARQIASTPHMMGRGMQYGGWLALRAEGVQDEKTAQAAKEAVAKVPGVANVVVYPAQESIGVAFQAAATATSDDIVEALAEAGIKAGHVQ